MVLPREIHQFIDAAAEFDTASWTVVHQRGRELWAQGAKEASEVIRPSAAEHSEIEKAVRDVLRPHGDTMKAAGRYAYSPLLSSTRQASAALLKRDRLEPAQLHLLLDPFLEAGLDPQLVGLDGPVPRDT